LKLSLFEKSGVKVGIDPRRTSATLGHDNEWPLLNVLIKKACDSRQRVFEFLLADVPDVFKDESRPLT
jgi:hypothetical protein